MNKKIKLFGFFIGLLLLSFSIPEIFAEEDRCTENCSIKDDAIIKPDIERPKFYKEIEPDIHIDFSNNDGWEGLKDNRYWKVSQGEGHFFLKPGAKQIESATFDLLSSIDFTEIGSEWVLRYKLTIDAYKENSTDKWSELLIGIHDSKNSVTTNQWGMGVAFLTGANLKLTNIMYDFGTYNEWHCCPTKAEFQKQESFLNEKQTIWVEYVRSGENFTIRFFEDNDYRKLIEVQNVTGWETEDLQYLRIFPLVEDPISDGFISGTIDDIKFYNYQTTVYLPDKKPLPEELQPKTMEEMLKEVYGDNYTDELLEEIPDTVFEELFPSQEEIDMIEPIIWKYHEGKSKPISLINTDSISSQKILTDFSRQFDVVHTDFEVPYTMMQIFQFHSNELAKSFLEDQIYVKNVIIDETLTEEDILAYDYSYERIYESADMSGTTKETGDCLYDKTVNITNAIGDETHFVQCVLHDKVIQVFMYEDYTMIDANFAFRLMDIILQNINEDNDKSVKNVLKLDNLPKSPPKNKINDVPQKESSLPEKQKINQKYSNNPEPKNDNIDPELSGTFIGITNFSCKQDDFGTVNMFGQFINGETSFEKVPVNIIIESYNGEVLAFGQENIMKVNSFEDRDIEGYVFLDKPFYKCYATVDWERTK
tara:strand:+ start:719 stop:2668 length:1950 start_codon:yes stop_codon:yes gene_type:complete